MNIELAILTVLLAGASVSLLIGLLRIARRVSIGATSSLLLRRFWRGFPVPVGLVRRPAVLVSHLFLTWGLVVMSLRFVTLAGRVSAPGYALFADWESFHQLYVPLHEWTALGMLAAVGFLLLRRWVLKPRHLALNLSSEFFLFWPALVLVCDLVRESAHMALLVESGLADHSVISGALGHMFMESGFYKSEMVALSRFALWTSLLGVAAALASAPYGRNTHWFTGWLGLILRSRVDAQLVGAKRTARVSSKALVDALNCTECGQCDVICEGKLGLQAVRPSQVPLTLRRLVRADATGDLLEGWQGAIGDAVLARCIGCGDCDASCPLGIELTTAIAALLKSAGLPLPISSPDGDEGELVPALENPVNE